MACDASFNSCTQENEEVSKDVAVGDGSEDLIPIKIHSDINGGRTALNSDGKTVKFDAGDELVVWDGVTLPLR